MRNKLPIVLIVLGLTMTAFSAWDFGRVSAQVPHVVDGAVGPSTAPGLGNPSNPASATFYLTNKPALPIEVQSDITDATGTQVAEYGWDVGSPWTPDPQTGDEVVVVIETIDGVNGWVGVDYTTSSDGIIDKSVGVTSLPATDIEPFPTLTILKYPTYVNVTWTNLIDTNANVVNYSVYRADNPVGPFNLVGESQPHVSSQANWYEETVSMGQWCYNISVNYRRDTTGGVHKTQGRSETQCTTIGAEPFIQLTDPYDTEVDVALTADIVVTFSEAMNTGSVTWQLTGTGAPTLGSSWNTPINTILTLTPMTPYTECITYTAEILDGRDADDDFALVAGPVPNPWSFTALCNNPIITRTVPADGATEVALDATIEVEFNMAMDTGTVTWTFSDPMTLTPTWNTPTDTIVTFTHTTDFMECTVYTTQITAGDSTTGQPLVPGSIPNPWSFTTICPPNATLTAPVGGEIWTGNTSHDITWTMSDNDPVTTLFVNLSYTSSAGSGAIAGPLTGLSSPATYSWTLPCINATDTAVTVEVKDMDGNTMTDTSLPFEIDCAPPTVVSVQPQDGAQDVAYTANIVITFSEDMAKTATQSAITVVPAVTNMQYAWSVSDTILTISHDAFQPGTYNVTVGTGALDNTSTGNALAEAYEWSFQVPLVQPNPNPPSNVQVGDIKQDSLTVSWSAPTTYTDGSTLNAADIAGYYIERATSQTGTRTNLTASGVLNALTYTDAGLASDTTYYYWVKTVMNDGRLSAWSSSVNEKTAAPGADDLLWLWILLIIIIIVVVLLIIMLYLRKKKAPAEVPPEEAVEAPPEEMAEVPPEEGVAEAPPEEAPPEPTTEEVPPEPTEPKPGEPA